MYSTSEKHRQWSWSANTYGMKWNGENQFHFPAHNDDDVHVKKEYANLVKMEAMKMKMKYKNSLK